MFTVTGSTPKGLIYRAAVGVDPSEPLARGVLFGPPHLMALLVPHEGRDLLVTPTGPAVTLDFSKPDSVLSALYALTAVASVSGDDIPDVIPALGEGEVG